MCFVCSLAVGLHNKPVVECRILVMAQTFSTRGRKTGCVDRHHGCPTEAHICRIKIPNNSTVLMLKFVRSLDAGLLSGSMAAGCVLILVWALSKRGRQTRCVERRHGNSPPTMVQLHRSFQRTRSFYRPQINVGEGTVQLRHNYHFRRSPHERCDCSATPNKER